MPITEADIKLLASERLNDDPDGGGFMTGVVVADGVENNLFPDISDADRTFGRVQLRKVYVAVGSNDRDTYLGAHLIMDEYPDDPAVSALIVSKAGYSDQRSDISVSISQSGYQVHALYNLGDGDPIYAYRIAEGPYTATDTVITVAMAGPVENEYWNGTAYGTSRRYLNGIVPGSIVGIVSASAALTMPLDISALKILTVAAVTLAPPDSEWYANYPTNSSYIVPSGSSIVHPAGPSSSDEIANVEFTRPIGRSLVGGGASGQTLYDYLVEVVQTGPTGSEEGLKFYGQTTTTTSLEAGDNLIPISSSWAQFIPVAEGGEYPTIAASVLGVDPGPYVGTGGRVAIFRASEACVVHHTETAAPQTVSNGQDINLGRTRLSKIRVFGANGVEITAGWTANKATGHIVFSNVAGYSQPVTISNRIEDMLLISSAQEQALGVARPITHTFPSGSKVSSVLMFGDLQARAHDGFAQSTWNNSWLDLASGPVPLSDYNEAAHPIVVTNGGAITERWAVIFTGSNSFKVIGEQVGEVIGAGGGSTATDTAPPNPATGLPYFTIPAAGWGTGWAAGNVYRFNTDGANAPVWLIRSIAPSDPYSGQDKFTVAIRGNVNA